MVDYQYEPEPDDPVTKLRMAMETFDGNWLHGSACLGLTRAVEAIQNYSIPDEKEDYVLSADTDAMVIDPKLSGEPVAEPSITKSNLRLFAPPLFSRQNVPQHYGCVARLKFLHQVDPALASNPTQLPSSPRSSMKKQALKPSG